MNWEVVGMRACREREVRLVEEPAVRALCSSLEIYMIKFPFTGVFQFTRGFDDPLQFQIRFMADL